MIRPIRRGRQPLPARDRPRSSERPRPLAFDPDGPADNVARRHRTIRPAETFSTRKSRTISNLIVDQTANNPAAYATAYDPGADGVLDFGTAGDDVLKDGVHIVTSPGLDGKFGTADDRDVFLFDNVAPDAGLSAPFNAWITFFGQFFDHGLDLVTKGGNGTIFMPLQADDPLVQERRHPGTADDLPAGQRFMVLTRATNSTGRARTGSWVRRTTSRGPEHHVPVRRPEPDL